LVLEPMLLMTMTTLLGGPLAEVAKAAVVSTIRTVSGLVYSLPCRTSSAGYVERKKSSKHYTHTHVRRAESLELNRRDFDLLLRHGGGSNDRLNGDHLMLSGRP